MFANCSLPPPVTRHRGQRWLCRCPSLSACPPSIYASTASIYADAASIYASTASMYDCPPSISAHSPS
eukprot:2039397-Rhodomonas_salina.1